MKTANRTVAVLIRNTIPNTKGISMSILRPFSSAACLLLLTCSLGSQSRAGETKNPPDPKDVAHTVKKVVSAVGGEDNLLKIFRIKEKLILNPDGKNKGFDRVSILAPPEQWWVGKTERVKDEKEPATFLVWAWTLGAVTNPKSKLTSLPEITDRDVLLIGLRVSGTINPAMDIYFDKKENRLARIDWRNDIHRFSEWKDLDGLKYPSRTIGYRKSGVAWYQSDITELTRLKELPKENSK